MQAVKVQKALKALGYQCELLVGGQFFITEAVLELRVLLEAVAAPSDVAALLELCETRWAPALLEGLPEMGVKDSSGAWNRSKVEPIGWLNRLSGLRGGPSLPVGDLQRLIDRVRSLQQMLRRMSAVAFVVECCRRFAPNLVERSGENAVNRLKYARNLNHLITLLDSQFADSPATIDSLLVWLRLQIAVNRSEDEPVEESDLAASTVAITVHKSKGLEFDHVIIPYTETSFDPPAVMKTHVFVVGENDSRKVRWAWSPSSGHRKIRNGADNALEWVTDEDETNREEARLLYVAMTRAKENLVMYVRTDSPRAAPGISNSETWGDLISKVAGF
jgi:ATP-dependent exoDNAse (exonuclease V) beta subunit